MLNYIHKFLAPLVVALVVLATANHLALADRSLSSTLSILKVNEVSIPSSVRTIKFELNNNLVKPGDPIPAKSFKNFDVDKISWDVNNLDARHTLILVDLDRRSGSSNSTSNSIYNQLTSLNIPGSVVNHGQTIVAYDPPTVPCQPSSKHRLLMLACHQQQNIDISEVAYMSASSGQTAKRENFKLADFLNRHRLEVIAANVFLATGDSSGVCSGATSLHSSLSSILIAMVITGLLTLTSGYLNISSNNNRRSIVN